jgi:hypothetical protein
MDRSSDARFYLLACVLLAALLTAFGGKFFDTSVDIAAHYSLADEIMKHGGLRPERMQSLGGGMEIYPRATHYLAAAVGWFCGSALVGLQLVSITAIYLIYFFIMRLVSANGALGSIVFAAIFVILSRTRAEIGWEVVGNYFYPQLVGTAVFFAMLYWLSRNEKADPFWRVAVVAAAGIITIWLHALPALHILAAGAGLAVFTAFQEWVETRKPDPRSLAAAALMVLSAGLIVALHPTLRVWAAISRNDGYLAFTFGLGWIPVVLAIAGGLGAFNLYRRLRGAGSYVDAVLGSAVLASAGLMTIQYAALHMFGAGTPYAVKKHMFIIVTLGGMNAARLIIETVGRSFDRVTWQYAVPVAAAFATAWTLWGIGKPVGPTLQALRYADELASSGLPDFKPGSVVYAETSAPPMSRFLVSVGALQYMIAAPAFTLLTDEVPPAKYVMLQNTPGIEQACPERFGETAAFVAVPRACLWDYAPGTPIDFAMGGDSWRYKLRGWYETQDWGTWSQGKSDGELLIRPQVSGGALTLNAAVRAFVNSAHPSQVVKVFANDTEIAVWTFAQDQPVGQRAAVIPAEIAASGELKIVFLALDPVAPAEVSTSADARVLGIGIKSLELKHAPD